MHLRHLFKLILCLLLLSSVGYGQQLNDVLSPRLRESARKPLERSAQIRVLVNVHNVAKAIEALVDAGINVPENQVIREYNCLLLRTDLATLDSLLVRKGLVKFIELQRVAKEETLIPGFDPTTNQVNVLHGLYPSYNGTGFSLSIKEQAFDSSDIDLINRVVFDQSSPSASSSHATRMATIAAGAGNSSPFSKGAAWGARVHSSSFETLLPDNPQLYIASSISVQNHSYGTGIENYYATDAAAYDQLSIEQPWLLHVFSAGNIGLETPGHGRYAGLPAANLSGSFKMSKNSLVVGAIDSFYNVESRSSRGPAYDGRIKPELVAFGQEGSSGAAAMVSGISIALQDAYRSKNGILPTSALLRAVLVNTATDLLKPGPDFVSGFGSVDAYKAIQAILNGDHYSDTVDSRQTKNVNLIVPENIASLKITLAWLDPPASPNAHHALINNLDLSVEDPDGGTIRPLVLSSFPHIDSLGLPAMPGVDTLNNIEQVVVHLPRPGSYRIIVDGSRLTGSQPFSLSWLLEDKFYFKWNFPVANDHLEAGHSSVLRWRTSVSGSANLYFREAGGIWKNIGSVELGTQFHRWVPTSTTGTGQLKIETADTAYISDLFTISRQPSLKVGYVCGDSVMLFWRNAVADSFNIYRLGEKYMERVATVSDTMWVTSIGPSKHFAVAPKFGAIEALRSLAIQYDIQGVSCYYSQFLADGLVDVTRLRLSLSALAGLHSVTLQKKKGSEWVDLTTVVNLNALNFEWQDEAIVAGYNEYRVRLTTASSQFYSNIERVFHWPKDVVIAYPNPTRKNNKITIAIQDFEGVELQIYDSFGRLLLRKPLEDVHNDISLAGFSAGVYFYRVIRKARQEGSGQLVIQ